MLNLHLEQRIPVGIRNAVVLGEMQRIESDPAQSLCRDFRFCMRLHQSTAPIPLALQGLIAPGGDAYTFCAGHNAGSWQWFATL